MLFNSIAFLIFFPLVVSIYFLLPARWRWIHLLAASYFFYAYWRPEYLILILISTAVDYFASYRMSAIPTKKGRAKYLILSLVSNLGLLFTFKYFNFFNDSLRYVFETFDVGYGIPHLNVLLPVGISFYTFQTLSYTIDVYNGKTKPEKHPGIFALYVAFWPQLVAGPIERPNNLLPQLRQKFDFDYSRVRSGLLRMLWGFFKKVVIADRLAIYVNTVYNHPGRHEGVVILLATYLFAFQIYCDFSGYSDIAIGAARVMGFNLMENFRRPYFAKSIREFWRRWHISLSTWFRDYVYIPLGGNRVVKWRWYYNLFITFVISGLWHGANWTFVIWGALHGFYLLSSIWLQPIRQRFEEAIGLPRMPFLNNVIKTLGTFHLVLLGWIFFRANHLSDALLFIRKIFTDFGSFQSIFLTNTYPIFCLFLIMVLLVHEFVVQDSLLEEKILARPIWMRWSYYVAITLFLLWFGVFTSNQFIYFQF